MGFLLPHGKGLTDSDQQKEEITNRLLPSPPKYLTWNVPNQKLENRIYFTGYIYLLHMSDTNGDSLLYLFFLMVYLRYLGNITEH